MQTLARPGAVVAWWDDDDLRFGLVAAEEQERVRLVQERGREERIKASRIAVEVVPPAQVPGSSLAERREAGLRVSAVGQRLREQAGAIDVRLLWEVVTDGAGAGAEAQDVRELAELALESSSGESRAIVLLALLRDGVHFVRRGDSWVPRPQQQVAQLLHEREQRLRREDETREFFAALSEAGRGNPYGDRGTGVERQCIAALEQLAAHEQTAPEAARELALQALQASGLRWERPHEGAFRLLRRLGRFSSDDENLQPLRFGLRTEFPESVLALARSAAERGFDRSGRTDLTSLEAVTIDGQQTQELDDALSLEPLAGDSVRIGVHIADPAAFIHIGDALDQEALSRSLTYYMPDLRLPMLPPAISEGAASLIEHAERPALSFLITLDAQGEITHYELRHAIVRSRARLDYAGVDQALATGAGPHAPLLRSLASAAALRLAARLRRGAMRIEHSEVEVHVHAGGRLELERLPAVSPARDLVMEAMILAGEVAARFCQEAGLPVIFRRQAASERATDLLAEGGHELVVARRLLRSMRRAEASLEPAPHSSLGLSAYVQVTSPIRRFQDLTTHRQIIAHLRGQAPAHDRDAMKRILATTERADADARRAERKADEYWLLRYLEGQLGQEVEAVVVELEPRAVVQLVETLLEQPVPGLAGAQLGQRLRLRIERINPRAGVLGLRLVDPPGLG